MMTETSLAFIAASLVHHPSALDQVTPLQLVETVVLTTVIILLPRMLFLIMISPLVLPPLHL
jgi:hypothetical protein